MQDTENPATIATLLGAGPATIETVRALADRASILVAADGGVIHAERAGLLPDLILGDFDSLPNPMPEVFASVPRRHMPDQDSTDFDKALRIVDADLCLCAGFLDGRSDHTLACFHSLLVNPARRVILVSETDVVTLLPPRLRVAVTEGCRVSVFPMQPGHARSQGLRWPLNDLPLAPDGVIACSNEAVGDTIHIEADQPHFLLILPKSLLGELVFSLLQTDLWPGD